MPLHLVSVIFFHLHSIKILHDFYLIAVLVAYIGMRKGIYVIGQHQHDAKSEPQHNLML